MKMLWIKNTNGRPDAVLTFALVSMVIVFFKLMFAGVEFSFDGFKWIVQTIDAATIGAILVPTLGAYVSNKYVNLQYNPEYDSMYKKIEPPVEDKKA